ncbi:hypothetical protein O6H91_04G116200 [Diphasiastrum complanatum]|uniref:Uncharacterized protein n=1 Tax=Diphasiastrum complanatum TaxID=34168 RepID=A0ACC2E114_DIPCM|nr:hypothetical protein O6H91_Y259200 [Diphasiastrum complanatum]KAJ7560149.1 hypothetical protein O6H91_04G116200 [Diphasiastrum complanatum]
MQRARITALAVTVGNLLQGWDNGAIAGALLYLKPEFGLVDNPVLEGIVVASTLVGAWMSTLFAGPGADWIGRRWMLCVSGIIFSTSASIMYWAPNVYVLLVGRLLVGAAIGLEATIIPIYIAESSPPEIRGQLSTFPQLMGSGGLFLGYITVFILSLTNHPNWRYMLGCLLIPSIIFLSLTLLYLPESPSWLVSKGRMSDAKKVLLLLRNTTDVAPELALLVEGLGVGARTTLEEWLLEPADIVEQNELPKDERQIKIFNPDEGISGVARSFTDQIGIQGIPTRRDTAECLRDTFMDPVVTLLGSFSGTQEHISQRNLESLQDSKDEHWPEESNQRAPLVHSDQFEDGILIIGEMDEPLTAPLLPRPKLDVPRFSRSNSQIMSPRTVLQFQHGSNHNFGATASRHCLTNGSLHDFLGNLSSTSSNSKSSQAAQLRTSSMDIRRDSQSRVYFHHSSLQQGKLRVGSISDSMGIGGGWQLVWRWDAGTEGPEANCEGASFRRVFLKQEQVEHTAPTVSALSLPGLGGGFEREAIPAAALVGKPAQSMRDLLPEIYMGPAMVHPAETVTKGPAWSDLLEGGVRRALIVGVGLQIFQQFIGINAVLYFIPQIIRRSGTTILLENMGIGADSGSILASGITCLITLPCILLAMRLMDQAGRRQLLLATLPLLIVSLISLVFTNTFLPSGPLQAAASLSGLTAYLCTFVMGFGPIPNILCSEIYPIRVRGICISICQATYWLCELIVTNGFPSLLLNLGIAGIFGCFAVASLLAWIFVFLKVPETKGMPLEVISEFFAMSASERQKPETTDVPVDV